MIQVQVPLPPGGNRELYSPLKTLTLYDLVLVYHPGGGQHGPGTVVHKQGGAPQDAGERRAV